MFAALLLLITVAAPPGVLFAAALVAIVAWRRRRRRFRQAWEDEHWAPTFTGHADREHEATSLAPALSSAGAWAPQSPHPTGPEYQISLGRGEWPNVDLVGVQHYLPAVQAALSSAATSGIASGPSREAEGLRVVLVPEPDNPYDSNAISVRWAGRTIGYLSRDDAARYSQPVRRITASGFAPVSAARIWAWDGSQMMEAQVTVALPEPELIAPLNEPPTTTHTLVPWGAAVQVLRTEDHFSTLFDYVPEEGVGLLLVSLHKATRTLKNGTLRSLVEVRLDGNRVGELSGITSPHYLPLLEHTETVGELAVCYAKITGSALAAKLSLQAQRASEISNSWLANSPHPAPRLAPWARSYDVPAAYVPRH
jgi:hypothetical protein